MTPHEALTMAAEIVAFFCRLRASELRKRQTRPQFEDRSDEASYLQDETRAAILALRDSLPKDAPEKQAVPEGWKLVPMEPTEAMLKAVPSYDRNSTVSIAVYRVMLAAAPTPGNEEH